MFRRNKNSPASLTKPALKERKNWLDIIEKLTPLLIAISGGIGGYWLVNDVQSQRSSGNLLTQREQAETNLRATMFNNLMERIVTKDQKKLDPEKMLLLAELLALNFDEHFQFKPLLSNLKKKLKPEESLELESIARRIVDRQTDILRAAITTQGDEYQQNYGKVRDIFASDLFFEKIEKSNNKNTPIWLTFECSYIDTTSFDILDKSALEDQNAAQEIRKAWKNAQQQPAYFINEGPSQCIFVVSPDMKVSPDSSYLLEIAIVDYKPKEETVTVSVNVTGTKLRSISTVYEFDVTPFDFPLTDNTAIDSDHRFAISQRSITEDKIWLRLVWFPKGYITERERPMNYSEIRKILEVQKMDKESWWSNFKNRWLNFKDWWRNLPPPPPMDSTL